MKTTCKKPEYKQLKGKKNSRDFISRVGIFWQKNQIKDKMKHKVVFTSCRVTAVSSFTFIIIIFCIQCGLLTLYITKIPQQRRVRAMVFMLTPQAPRGSYGKAACAFSAHWSGSTIVFTRTQRWRYILVYRDKENSTQLMIRGLFVFF